MGDGLDLLIDAMPGLLDRVTEGYELATPIDSATDVTTLVATRGGVDEGSKAPDRIRIDIDPETYEVRRLVLEWNHDLEMDEASDSPPRPAGRGDHRRPRGDGRSGDFDRRPPPPGSPGMRGDRRRPVPPPGRPGPGRNPLVDEVIRAEAQGPARPPARITFERVPASAFEPDDFVPTVDLGG